MMYDEYDHPLDKEDIENFKRSVDGAMNEVKNELMEELEFSKLMGKYKKEIKEFLKTNYPEEFV